jgi:hypothetical protein
VKLVMGVSSVPGDGLVQVQDGAGDGSSREFGGRSLRRRFPHRFSRAASGSGENGPAALVYSVGEDAALVRLAGHG